MSTPCENCGSDFRVCISCDLYNSKYIEIPDNATNGDVIKAVFPNVKIELGVDNVIFARGLNNVTPFSEDWWNAQYQKGGK